jgi:hypothetical protein
MKVKVRKLWHGCVSVKDYEVKKAMDKGEDLTIILGSEQMTVPHTMLASGYKNSKPMKSKHGTEPYYLVDYPWRPDKPTNQQLL